jgi:8-oxo-dGTP diphosphatase
MSLETRLGVGVLVVRDGCVLLGERRGSHGAGTWAPPGGHLENGEDVATCAQRELREETGLELHEWRAGPWSVDAFPDVGRRYITLFIVARDTGGDAELREPHRCVQWQWWPWTQLPSPLFTPLASLVASGQLPVV